MAETQETGGFFPGQAGPLYGTFHAAAGAARTAVLVFPPFGEERKCAWRLLTLTARALATAGCDVLRFDYRGTGDSHGDPGRATLADWEDDGRRALATLRGLSAAPRVLLLGARLGANLAARAAATGSDALVLWEPLPNGADFLDELLRRRQIKAAVSGTTAAATPGAAQPAAATPGGSGELWPDDQPADFDGFAVAAGFARELRALALAPALATTAAPTLLLHLAASPRLPPAWQQLSEAFAARPGSVFKTIRERPFWGRLDYHESEVLIHETVAFCRPVAG